MPGDGAPRRRVRATNALLEPPFQLASEAPQPAELPVWHRFCPCTRFTAFDKLPAHLADNGYIRNGYRVEWTARQSLVSVFQLHNETVNIWSHLAGFLFFLGLSVYFACNHGGEYRSLAARAVGGASARLSEAAALASARLAALEAGGLEKLAALEHALEDAASSAAAALAHGLPDALAHGLADALPPAELVPRWPIFVFLAGACTCLLLSAFCHTFGSMSRAVNASIWRLDYAGIAALIACSFYPPVYYAFLCAPWWRSFYLGTITAFAAATLVVSTAERFQSPVWRSTRASLFSALGLFGVVPILHQAFFFWHVLPDLLALALAYEVLMGFLYLLGAFLYAKRIPERYLPGAFDYALHSHNLFHFLVVIAAYVHVHASLILLAWRDGQACAADESLRWL